MAQEDHSFYGYCTRRSDYELKIMLAQLRQTAMSDITRFNIDMVTRVLRERGIDPNTDLSKTQFLFTKIRWAD